MEHSISQLVVDDDENDPAILKSKPIPKVLVVFLFLLRFKMFLTVVIC